MGGIPCGVCGKRLRTRYNLRLHMAVHTGDKAYICEICNRGYQQKWNLVTHISRVHIGHKPFHCKDCGRLFGYASHFKAHVKIHFLAQLDVPDVVKDQMKHPHACTECPRRFESTRLLNEHVLSHRGERAFTCHRCSKGFTSRRQIVRHFQRACCDPGNQRKKQVCRTEPTPCEICGKVVARYSMPKHINIHTRRRTYPCKTCNKTFLEAGQLSTHQRLHLGLKPHICEACGKAHAQIGNLLAHRRRHHGLSDKPLRRTAASRGVQVAKPHCSDNEFVTKISERQDLEQPAISNSDRSVTDDSIAQKTQEPECTGNENLQDFLKIADKWIADRVQESKATQTQSEKSDTGAFPNFFAETIENSENEVDSEVESNNEEYTGNEESENRDTIETCREEQPNREQEITDIILLNNTSDANEVCYNDQHDRKNEKPVTIIAENLSANEVGSDGNNDGKQKILDAIISEIGQEPMVKALLLRARKKNTKDILRTLLGKLGDNLPVNSVVQRQSDGSYLWRCWDCQATLKSRPLLIRHRYIHSPPHLRPHRCETCNRTFTQAGNLQHHLLVHRQEHRFYCEVCGAGFRHKSHFKTHLQRHDKPTLPRFQCETCGKACSTRSHLFEHMRTHTKERPYLCRICGQQFGASSTYARHLRQHDGVTTACSKCEKRFTDDSSRRRHEKNHGLGLEYECPCGKSFTQKASLQRHLPVCSKAPEPAVRQFQCPACPKAFLDHSSLKRHSFTHDPTRRFTCQVCNLKLKSKETLVRHIARHRSTDKSKEVTTSKILTAS